MRKIKESIVVYREIKPWIYCVEFKFIPRKKLPVRIITIFLFFLRKHEAKEWKKKHFFFLHWASNIV